MKDFFIEEGVQEMRDLDDEIRNIEPVDNHQTFGITFEAFKLIFEDGNLRASW